VFIIASVIFFVGNCIYLVFGTAETQPWDAEDYLQTQNPELANGPPMQALSFPINENSKEKINSKSH